MPLPSTCTSPENDGASDSSPGRESEDSWPPNDPKSAAMPNTEDHRFILDSGAAEHATGIAELLSGARAPEGGRSTFRRRDGKTLPVVAVGSLNTPRFSIPSVRHVPELGPGFVLVSVRQLTRRGLAVTFCSDSCHVKERSTGDVVGEGRLREEDGFYHLDFLRIPQS